MKSNRNHNWYVSIKNLQIDYASKYPFIEPICNTKEGETLIECRCMICSRINKKEKRLLLKIDTIEKHTGKVYEKQIIDEVEKSITRWKTKEGCQHIKNTNFLEF